MSKRHSVADWTEVADRVFQRRYDPYDVTVCAVVGTDGILLVDTRASPRQADQIKEDLRHLSRRPLRCVVNTHAHFDHCFGNQRFGSSLDAHVPIYGHARMPAHLATFGQQALRDAPDEAEWREIVITPPSTLVERRAVLDLGDRRLELMHLGRGHTDNDLLIHVPDANAWLVGDIVEESGAPMYGPDCFPLEWPATVAALLQRLGENDVVVPGHGAAVDLTFVADQFDDIQLAAEVIGDAHAAELSVDDAAHQMAARWPFSDVSLRYALTAGFRQLPNR